MPHVPQARQIASCLLPPTSWPFLDLAIYTRQRRCRQSGPYQARRAGASSAGGTNGAHDQPGGIWSGGSHVTKREGASNRRGFLANGLSLAGAPVNLSILCDSPGRTPHHSHSIVRVEPNELICHCKNLSALKTPVARTVRCARLLNSKRNLIAPENLRFQRLSLSIGPLFSNQPAAPHRRHSRRLPSAARVERSRLGFRPDYGKRRRRPAARQSRDMDIPARSGAYAASLRDTNSVKSRTRFVLRVSPDILLQLIPTGRVLFYRHK